MVRYYTEEFGKKVAEVLTASPNVNESPLSMCRTRNRGQNADCALCVFYKDGQVSLGDLWADVGRLTWDQALPWVLGWGMACAKCAWAIHANPATPRLRCGHVWSTWRRTSTW